MHGHDIFERSISQINYTTVKPKINVGQYFQFNSLIRYNTYNEPASTERRCRYWLCETNITSYGLVIYIIIGLSIKNQWIDSLQRNKNIYNQDAIVIKVDSKK